MMSVASHDLFNTKLRTCLDTGLEGWGIFSATLGIFALQKTLWSPLSSSLMKTLAVIFIAFTKEN